MRDLDGSVDAPSVQLANTLVQGIPGLQCAAVVDLKTLKVLGAASTAESSIPSIAAPYLLALVQAQQTAHRKFSSEERGPQEMITFYENRVHVLRTLDEGARVLFLVADHAQFNLAWARHFLTRCCGNR